MPNICRAKYRWTGEELLKAMRHHNRMRKGPACFVIMKVCAAVLLVSVGIAWIVEPPTSPPWGMLAVAAVSLYWLFYDKINAWYGSRGFSKRS